MLGLFSDGEMAYANEIAAGSEQPSLADMTRRAIQLLQWNTSGYLLIVDAGLMRTAARENHGERTLAETVELDRAIAVAGNYAGDNSTVLVVGNFGIGGLSLNGFPFRRDSGVALLGINSSGEPALTWATGPNGIVTRSLPPGSAPEDPTPPGEGPAPASGQEPAAVYAPWARNTVDDVLAAGADLAQRRCTASSTTRSFSKSSPISCRRFAREALEEIPRALPSIVGPR